MSIKFRCTCGKSYKVSDGHAGRKMVCKGCRKKLRVPQGAAVQGAPVPEASATNEFEYADDPAPARSSGGAVPPPLVNAKRKRRKPATDEDARKSRDPSKGKKTALIAGLILFGLLGVAGLGFVVVNAANSDKAPEGPQTYVKYESEHGGFSSDYPEGWEADGKGGTGGLPPWARFKDGTASISIKASRMGTSIADMSGASQAPGGLGEMDDDLTPIAQVHDFQYDLIAARYSDYEEQPGENIKIPWGEVRISEFTATEGEVFGSKVRGYRMTMANTQRQFNVICQCPKRKWEQYQPIFDHVIHSIDY